MKSPVTAWIAYTSNESGSFEVYVQSFPEAGNKAQISINGGAGPRWSGDDRELFYITPDRKLMSVAVVTRDDGTLSFDRSRTLFETPWISEASVRAGRAQNYEVTADGKRFLMRIEEPDPPRITLVLNWTTELEGKEN